MVEYEIPWRRGCFVAKVEGSDPVYGLAFTFEQGLPVKSKGGLRFQLDPGFYAVQEEKGGTRRFITVNAVTSSQIRNTWALANMAIVTGGPAPGADGAWNGDRCECGQEVQDFDLNGFPWCASHLPYYAPPVEMPVPA